MYIDTVLSLDTLFDGPVISGTRLSVLEQGASEHRARRQPARPSIIVARADPDPSQPSGGRDSCLNQETFIASQMSRREIEGASTIQKGGEDNVPLPFNGYHLVLSREVEGHQVALLMVLAQVDETGGILLLNGLVRTKGQGRTRTSNVE